MSKKKTEEKKKNLYHPNINQQFLTSFNTEKETL